jgi:signal transduction histidine kinase
VSALDGSTVGGEIDVEVSELHAPERVEIAVATSGGALGPDELARLLDGESPQVGGGLPIARRFLEAHGGRLSVWQDPESGTRFTLTLPRDGGAA